MHIPDDVRDVVLMEGEGREPQTTTDLAAETVSAARLSLDPLIEGLTVGQHGRVRLLLTEDTVCAPVRVLLAGD